MTQAIDKLRPDDEPALATFLAAQPARSIFYTPGWARVLEAGFGHQTDYWVARSGGEITGVFPVVQVRFPLLGLKSVAGAYQMESALPLASDPGVAAGLVARAVDAARASGARHMEVRYDGDPAALQAAGFTLIDARLVTTIVPLADYSMKSVRRNHRRLLKDSLEGGLTVDRATTLDDLRRFHRLYQEEGRRLGAPKAGWAFFAALATHAPDAWRLYFASSAGRVIAGLLVLDDGRTIHARHAAYSTPEAMRLQAPRALYWKALSDGAAAGAERLSCGISHAGDSGLISWKEGWGGVTRPVGLAILPLRGAPPAPGSYLEGYGLARRVWRRLPLAVTEPAGALVTRWIC